MRIKNARTLSTINGLHASCVDGSGDIYRDIFQFGVSRLSLDIRNCVMEVLNWSNGHSKEV